MNRLLKTTVLGAAVTAMALTAMPANARDWHRHGGHHYHHRHHGGGDALAAGIAGLAVGAIAAGVLAPRPAPVYVEPRPVYRTGPRVIYYDGGIEPWTPAWYDACSVRYRSFDARSGTYMGYDGERHLCSLN